MSLVVEVDAVDLGVLAGALCVCGAIAGHVRAPCVNEKSGVDDRDSAGVRNSSVRGKATTRHLAGGAFDRDLALGYIRVRVVDLMLYRPLGRTGRQVSEIGFGAWAIGAGWGRVGDEQSWRRRHAPTDAGDSFITDGRIASHGVSVERVEEGLKAIDYPNVATVQIIYNIFRQRPAERFLSAARERNVGVIARVPLASGLLTGKFNRDTKFAATDHRNFNRHGESFDVGETFAGVDYETALVAVEEVGALMAHEKTKAPKA